MGLSLIHILIGNYDYNGAGTDMIARAIAGNVPAYAFLIKMLLTAPVSYTHLANEECPVLFSSLPWHHIHQTYILSGFQNILWKKLLCRIQISVSYTHLDVYKRQGQYWSSRVTYRSHVMDLSEILMFLSEQEILISSCDISYDVLPYLPLKNFTSAFLETVDLSYSSIPNSRYDTRISTCLLYTSAILR